MSDSSWFDDNTGPGPIGSVSTDAPTPSNFPRPVILILGIVSLAAVAVAVYFLVQTAHPWQWCAALVVYLAASYWIDPQPDYSNVGWLHGLANNPFRISDDINRGLRTLKLLLLPGRFVTASIRDLVSLARNPGERIT
jgi:hypothetical protein